MNKQLIVEHFRNLTVWKRKGERAPHKPLLVLLAIGKLLQNKSRMIFYEDIDKDLDLLLREFGPARLHYRTEYPFWRLYQAGGPDTEVNGIALCVLHHKLFDRGAFTLSDEMNILVSTHANGTTGFQKWLMNYHGKKMTRPQRTTYCPDMEFVEWHVKEVFRGEYREV